MTKDGQRKALLWIGNDADPKSLLGNIDTNACLLIGVDKGAARLIESGYAPDIAIGDFDSVSASSLEKIKAVAKKTIILPTHKDESDTEAAYKLVASKADEIEIYGVIGGNRIEHFLAALTIVKRDEKVSLIDDNTRIFSKKSRQKPYKLTNRDAYYSFFAIEDSIITLEGFAYGLNHYRLHPNDPLCLSNELAEDLGKLTIESGCILIIETRKDANR